MSIRVSSNQMVYGYQKQLNDANTRQTKLLEQGDGSKLHRPSDNSVDYSKYLRYSVSEGENLQYQDNVSSALSWMKTSDAALVNMTSIQTTFKEKTVAAANSTNNESDMVAIAKENVLAQESEDYVSITLTDAENHLAVDVRDRLEACFPNLLHVGRESREEANYQLEQERAVQLSPFALCRDFLQDLDGEEENLLASIINEVQEAEK